MPQQPVTGQVRPVNVPGQFAPNQVTSVPAPMVQPPINAPQMPQISNIMPNQPPQQGQVLTQPPQAVINPNQIPPKTAGMAPNMPIHKTEPVQPIVSSNYPLAPQNAQVPPSAMVSSHMAGQPIPGAVSAQTLGDQHGAIAGSSLPNAAAAAAGQLQASSTGQVQPARVTLFQQISQSIEACNNSNPVHKNNVRYLLESIQNEINGPPLK